jgi:hypothetical protein
VESEAQPNTWNDVGDTARMHVRALDGGRVAGNQSFLASSSGQDGMRFVVSSYLSDLQKGMSVRIHTDLM